jgi:hypothetical protein
MNDTAEIRSEYRSMIVATERNTQRLLPLLDLLEPSEGPDRIAQLMEILGMILNAQHSQAVALKSLAEKVDRLPRR